MKSDERSLKATKRLKGEPTSIVENAIYAFLEVELSEKAIYGLKFSLKSATESRLKILTTKINELRVLRCDNECISVADDLLKAIKVFSEKQLSAP